MNCSDYRKLISAYMDGELHGEELLLLKVHREKCEGCESVYESEKVMTRQIRKFGETSEPPLPQDFLHDLMNRIHHSQASSSSLGPPKDLFSSTPPFRTMGNFVKRYPFSAGFSVIIILGLLALLGKAALVPTEKELLVDIYDIPPVKNAKVNDLKVKDLENPLYQHAVRTQRNGFNTGHVIYVDNHKGER